LCIRCYECTSESTYNQFEYDACLYGDERYLRSTICREPSVCTAYHYQTLIPGALNQLSTSRGCQALRYGATCEDIFNDLRRTGSVLPGQHICTTCSEDLCNGAPEVGAAPVLYFAMLVRLVCANISAYTSLSCYSCTATIGSNFRCENLSFSGGTLPYYTCLYGDAVCAKYVIEYGDSLMIHRSCQHRDICAVLASKYNSYYSRLLDCQTCDDANYCNESNIVTFIPLLAIALLLIVSRFPAEGWLQTVFPGDAALKCYKCEAQKGKDAPCETLQDHIDDEECREDHVCAEYTIKGKFGEDGNHSTDVETIARSCRRRDFCDRKETEHGTLEHCRVCHLNLCNSGQVLGFSLVLTSVGLILARFIN
ncbi:uncharacterized protein BDFB_004755, partial [Asbolus verrucosus]